MKLGIEDVKSKYLGQNLVKAEYLGQTKVFDPFLPAADQEFLYRKSGGKGPALIDKIKGKTIVWNQLYGQTVRDLSYGGITVVSVSGQPYCTVSGESTIASNVWIGKVNFQAGHKYFIKGGTSSFPISYLLPDDSYVTIATEGAVITATADYETFIAIVLAVGMDFGTNTKIPFRVHDLSIAGLDTLTAAEFAALYPLPYYPYQSPLMKNNDADGIESVGFNQWDEEWEQGTLDNDGQPAASTSNTRTKNFTSCFGNTNYYFHIPGTWLEAYFYDANKNFIVKAATDGGSLTPTGESFHVKKTPANAAFVKFRTSSSYGGTYNHDICINISDPDRNGQYMPYWKKDIRLNLSAFDVEDAGGNIKVINGLDGVGTAYDEIIDGNKLIKRMGVVNLATLNWTLNSSGVWATSDLLFPGVGAADKAVILAEKYENVVASVANMGTAGRIGGNQWALSCNNGSTVDPPSGLMVYKLTTEEHYTLVDPIKQYLQVDVDGTERAVPPEDETTPSAPFVASIRYHK